MLTKAQHDKINELHDLYVELRNKRDDAMVKLEQIKAAIDHLEKTKREVGSQLSCLVTSSNEINTNDSK